MNVCKFIKKMEINICLQQLENHTIVEMHGRASLR